MAEKYKPSCSRNALRMVASNDCSVPVAKKGNDENDASEDVKEEDNADGIDYINTLTEDSLLIVFSMLPIIDRFRVKRVCKRWQSIAGQPWRDIRTLQLPRHLDTYDPHVNRDTLNNKINGKVILKCGQFLTSLKLCITEHMDEHVLRYVKKHCPNIQKLELRTYHRRCIPNDFVTHIMRNLRNLHSLKFNYFTINPIDVKLILSNENLKVLSFGECIIYEHFDDSMTKLHNLKYLSLPDVQQVVTDDLLNNVARNCPNLEHLNINQCYQVTTVGVASLAQLSKLRSLMINYLEDVEDSAITDLVHLERFYCESCISITSVGISALLLNAPKLQIINIFNCGELTAILPYANRALLQRTNGLPLRIIVNSHGTREWNAIERTTSPLLKINIKKYRNYVNDDCYRSDDDYGSLDERFSGGNSTFDDGDEVSTDNDSSNEADGDISTETASCNEVDDELHTANGDDF